MSREDVEAEVRERLAKADVEGALACLLNGFGSEIYGLLVGLHRDPNEADEAFSSFAEKVWRGLPGFRWESSLRTWLYVVARSASQSHRRARRRAARELPLSAVSQLSAIALEVRSDTRSYLGSEARSGIAKLRAELSEDDQLLLVLRVDRGLEFLDIARIFLGQDASPSEVQRESARLRKRLQIVKQRIVDRARRSGLIGKKSRR